MKSEADSLRDRWHTLHDYKQRLAIVEERLEKYRKELDAIQKKKVLSGDLNIRKRALDFYIGRNEELRNRIKEEVLSIAISDLQTKSQSMPGFLNVTNKVVWGARLAAADIEQLDSIVNKFGSLGLSEYEIVLQLYRTDKKKYYKWVTRYIRKCLIPAVKNGVKANHLLFARRKLILHALDQYSKRNYIVACSILTLQIEGLIHDALMDMGESPELLDTWALREKCERLSRRAVDFVWAEYYALRFPLVRNRVAHGNTKIERSLSETAKDILLDFWCICYFVFESKSLPTNNAVCIVRNCAGMCPKRRNPYLWEYAELDFVDIPVFYRLGRTVRSMKSSFARDGFWKWCENDLEIGYDQVQIDKTIGLMRSIGKRFNVVLKANHAVREMIKKKKVHDAKVESELASLRRIFRK